MRTRWAARGVVAASLVVLWATIGTPQEGHPLTGTWSGDWGPTPEDRNHLTLVLEWDGERVNGILNPGPDAVTMDSVVLDATDWTVRLNGQATTGGQPAAIVAEGRLDDLASPHRTLSGRMRVGASEGDFRLVRD